MNKCWLVFLSGGSQGWWSLVGCRPWGHAESDTSEVKAAAAGEKKLQGNIFKNLLYVKQCLFETSSNVRNVCIFNYVIWYMLAFVCGYLIYQRNLNKMNCIIFILICWSRLVNYNCPKLMQSKHKVCFSFIIGWTVLIEKLTGIEMFFLNRWV